MLTGAGFSPDDYQLSDPKGKAFLRTVDYEAPHGQPDADYPLWMTTGRLVYHFHTRTKTGRSQELNDAAPNGYVQLSEQDAARYSIANGDIVEVTSRRGRVLKPAQVGNTGG